MSVFGGDSWAREAQCRKRRVDDLLIEGVEASAYKQLSSGKFACLVCANNPILYTPIMLSTHVNGSRHRAAELRHKDRDFAMQEEVKTRLALSYCDSTTNNTSTNISTKKWNTTTKKPLIERARKAASEVFHGEVIPQKARSEIGNIVGHAKSFEMEATYKGFVGKAQIVDYRERLDRELKFTSAGWKRDGHGRWYKDENAEFDSDEEDPNIVLNEPA